MKSAITNNRRQGIFSTLLLTFFLLFAAQDIAPQVVTGRLVDHYGTELPDIYLQLYIYPLFYTATSDSNGIFVFTGITDVEDEQLPTGYFISNNFPNPFNPTTRIMITLPISGNVRVEVYNILGESVTNEIEKYFNAGVNHIDLVLDGLPNGFYFARISIDEKYTVIKKMMLLYGSQHLSVNGGLFKPSANVLNNINKISLSTELDSLVATSSIIGRKTFTNLPNLTGDSLDLGDLTIERYCPGTPTVNYEGKTYNTVLIGSQCWLKENLDAGSILNKTTPQTNNGIIERYCYDDNPANCITYGGLYQWDETMQFSTTPGVQGICPPGWHIPTRAEYNLLSGAAGGSNALKEIGEGTGNGAGTNTSGFSALLAGSLSETQHYGRLHEQAQFWVSEEENFDRAYYVYFYYNDNNVNTGFNYKITGKSVRCIKD